PTGAHGDRDTGSARRRGREHADDRAGGRGVVGGRRVARHLRGRAEHARQRAAHQVGERRDPAPVSSPARERPARRLRAVRGRIGIGAQMVGVARGALAAALTYVKERKQFGKPIAEFQAVQFQLAQAATELEAARLMVYNAARLEDAGEPYTMQAAMAKLFAAQVAERVTSLAVELFGGYGYTTEYPVEKFYRDAKIGTIYEGTSNMQLNT